MMIKVWVSHYFLGEAEEQVLFEGTGRGSQ